MQENEHMEKQEILVIDFLAGYPVQVKDHALILRELLLQKLPDITEQVDVPARIVAYCYGQRYIDMVVVIIPSQKGLKLGFAYGSNLPDPHKILKGDGKLSRYVEIKSEEDIQSTALSTMIEAAVLAYQKRVEG